MIEKKVKTMKYLIAILAAVGIVGAANVFADGGSFCYFNAKNAPQWGMYENEEISCPIDPNGKYGIKESDCRAITGYSISSDQPNSSHLNEKYRKWNQDRSSGNYKNQCWVCGPAKFFQYDSQNHGCSATPSQK